MLKRYKIFGEFDEDVSTFLNIPGQLIQTWHRSHYLTVESILRRIVNSGSKGRKNCRTCKGMGFHIAEQAGGIYMTHIIRCNCKRR